MFYHLLLCYLADDRNFAMSRGAGEMVCQCLPALRKRGFIWTWGTWMYIVHAPNFLVMSPDCCYSGWWFGTFHILGIIKWLIFFQRGRYTTNQYWFHIYVWLNWICQDHRITLLWLWVIHGYPPTFVQKKRRVLHPRFPSISHHCGKPNNISSLKVP